MDSPFRIRPAPASLTITTERLVLRPIESGDAAAMSGYRGDAAVCRYLPFAPQSAADVEDRYGRLYGSTTLEGERAAVLCVIMRRDGGAIIGDVTLFGLDPVHGTAEIGWVIHPASSGHGFATEAVEAMLRSAFETFGVRRVVAHIDAENLASARLARRVGMRQEGHLVENEWFKGRWSDELTFAVLDREWRIRA